MYGNRRLGSKNGTDDHFLKLNSSRKIEGLNCLKSKNSSGCFCFMKNDYDKIKKV